ncbi:SDR family NAD(P)-dependent oxidoreductase [Amycolatopsis rubida]|uniref:SDR family NAD(P)-dependent oxidoreductase n=1 Tax=Amycolatopsis rubida TaxID=112413 RepID=A0ABX0C978_9PSEU|nr:SDR family NAD(P)-dependent oxidoreductase [Amycolatopsis sp. M39]MYW96571.1 SDR family NAD(P)-dependent oxidoreductase [Amycolatopsis rubida]NEC61556.1 SDR family NAD(P)-dependent oxidoreductase [Amycolatopsis rubida]OAP26605.1 putative oxidoreductase SadH [Amycolatopsis sp. M39]
MGRPSGEHTESVLITGAGSGLGLGTGLTLAARGHRVFATVERDDQIEPARAAFAERGLAAEVSRLDLLDPADREAAAALDASVLLNNAGFGAEGPLLRTDSAVVRKTFEVNVFGTLELTRLVSDRLVAAGRGGRIVFVTSVAGLFVAPGAGPYGASKFALEAMAQAVRQELRPHGIDVRVVEPGPFSTGFNEKLVENAPASEHDFSDFLAMQRDPAPAVETIARVAVESGPYRTIVPGEFGAIVREQQDRLWAETDLAGP